MRRKLLILGLAVFCATVALQSLMLSQDDMIDIDVWANEAEYLVTGNPLGFEGGGYGYPAGPIIYGIISIHHATGITYHDSVLVFVTLFVSLIVSLCCVIAYLIQKKFWWPAAIFLTLSLAPMYQHATPTSSSISVIAVLLCLFTLYLLKIPVGRTLLIWWGITAGFMLCTRLDVGSIMVAMCGAFLLASYGWRKLVLPFMAGVITFAIFDPFLWLIPVKHAKDMIIRITYHYFEYPGPPLDHNLVAIFSVLAFSAMILGAVSLFSKEKSLMPPVFTFTLFAVTAFLYGVFLTSHSQAMRYFQPMIFIWETLFPLFMFEFISRFRFSFVQSESGRLRAKYAAYSLVLLLLLLRSGFIFYSWWLQ